MAKGESSGISFDEYMRRKREEKEKNTGISSSQNNTNTQKLKGASSGKSFDDYMFEKHTASKVDSTSATKWFDDVHSTVKSLTDYINKNQGGYTAKYSEEYAPKIKELLQSSTNVSAFLEYHKNDVEDYETLKTTFSQYQSALKELNGYVSSPMTATHGEKATYDVEAGKAEVEGLLNGDEITALRKRQTEIQEEMRELGNQSKGKGATKRQKLQSELNEVTAKIKEIESQATQKKAYINQAEYIQGGIKLADAAMNAEDFAENSKYVSTKADGFWDKLTADAQGFKDSAYEYINNIGGYRDEYKRKHSIYSSDTSVDGTSSFEEKGYDYMNDDEIAIYNYYYATEGKDKAEEFLKSIQESLSYRKGSADFEQLENRTFAELVFGVEAGLDQFSSGMKNLFNTSDDYIPSSATQMTSSMVREDLADNGVKILGSSLGQIGYDLTTTTSNMLPSILTSAAVSYLNPALGSAVGAGLMGASAGGNAYAEMLNLGYDKGQARGYSLLVGASEAGLQYVLGGIGKLGGVASKNLTTKIATSLASKVDNALAKVAINTGTKLVGNMVSEFGEEYLQEVLTPLFKNIVFNTNEDVELFSTDALYSGILGALSAGLLEGGSTLRGEVGTYKVGKSIIEKGQVGNLADLGKTYSTDTEAFKIASQVNDSTDAYTLGQLLQEVGADSLTESNVAEIEKSLLRKGVAPENAKSIAKWIYKASQGEVLTKSQQSAIYDNPDIVTTLKEVAVNPNSTVNQRIQGYQDIVNSLAEETTSPEAKSTVDNIFEEETPQAGFAPYSEEYIANIAKEYEAIGISPENARVMAVAQLSNANANTSSPKTENIVDTKYDVSDDGKTTNLKTGNAVEIKNIADISSSGEANLTLDDGAVVKASDISFSSPVQAVFVENIGKMKVGKKPLGTNSANVLYQAAMTAWKKNPKMTADEAMSLVKGLEESYIYGAYNLGRERLTSRNEDGTAVLFAGELSQDQRKIAYELGVKDGVSKADADQKVIDELKEKSKGKTSKKSFGKIIFEDGINVDESTLTDTQKANLKGIKLLADLTSVEFHVFRSDRVGNTFKYSLPNGKKTSANGWFVAGTNQIWIDLNAGNIGEGTMLRTAAHEISHYIKAWSPTKWKAMADLLMQTFADNNVNTERMLNRQKDKIKRRYTKKDMPSESKLLDMAYEELVSDALTDMLTDGSIVNFIAEVKAKDKNLAQRILDAIKNLLKNWGLIIDDYKGRDLGTPEAQALSQFEDTFKKLQEMYRDALMDANETVATIGARNLADFAEAKNTEGESLFQYRAMEADESTYKDMLRKWGKMTDAQIDNLFTTIDKAMDIIKDNLEALDYAWESDIDDRAFSPVKPNSDSLYQVSLDFSTLCRKRLLQQAIQAQLQEALNQPLSREEGIAIRDALIALQEEGRQIEVACALCYVESARMKSPAQIKKFLNNREAVIKDFFANKAGGSMKAKIKQAEDTARENIHKENPNGIKGKNGSMLDPRTASLSAMPKKYAVAIRSAKKTAKESYKPTAEEQRIIDVAKKMTISDFTTPEGLANLAKNYSALFDVYTSYIRNATHSKGIEGDTWWRAGDSQNIGDVLIANMNRENGLRSQSWSDFQVIHLLDYIAATIELSTRNTKEQAYSKVPDYVELMGQTGVMINMSLIPARQFNGSLEYDSVEGMAYERALELREKYPATAGTICIGVDNQQIQMLLADSNIDYVIPYHKSSMAASVRKLMHIPTWSQYEEYQSEKNLSRKDAEAQANEYGVKLLAESDPNYHKHTAFSEWFDLEVAEQIAKMENANPSNKAMQKKYGVMYGGYMAMQDAANNYLKLCAERGIAPKFSHEKANFTSEENYWKLLIDRKMVNNATGEIIEQQAIKPIFDEGEVLRILNDELERYPSVKADQEYAVRKVTEKFLSGEVKSGMSAEAIAKVMKTPVDNIAKTNILASAEGETLLSDRDSEELTDDPRIPYNHRANQFEYNELISKPNMKITVVNDKVIYKPTATIRKNLVNQAIKNASSLGKTNENGNVVIRVDDIDTDVILSKNSLTHGLDRRLEVSAPVILNIGGILKNSIKINELTPDKESASGSYVLIGYAESTDYAYLVRMVVNQYTNELDTIDVLYAVNTKKETVGKMPGSHGKTALPTVSNIRIADLLEFVNKYFPELLPESVLRHFGYDARPSKAKDDLGKDVLFSDRDSEGNTLSKEQQEFFKDSKVRDEYGNLLVCYHGTDAEFSTFDADYISQDNKLGFGFYFLAGEKLQYSYKHPLKTYLNITNPITDTSRKFSREALTGFCNKLGIELDYDSADYDLDVYERLSYSYTGKTKDFLMVAIDTLGVDGVISENRSVAVAFLPEQIKETTNKTPTTDPDIRFSERDPEASNRAILANSLESAAKNDTERNKLAEYKKKISLIESEEQRLSEIQKQLFTKGAVEPSQRKALQFEAKQIANRINTYDRQLLNLESTTALKNVLNREKELARKKQKQKDNEYLKQYKEKVAKTTRELMDKHQESRKKAIESRSRTVMRHKIQRVVSELNQLLLKGSKERNVKLGLQPAVAAALEAINMDTVSADERVAKYNALIAKATDPDVIESLTATRDRIQSQGDVMASKLEDLRKAYAKIKANKEDAPEYYIAEASLIEQRIESVIEKVGNTPLRDMSLSQLEAVHDLYSMVLTTVRNANKVFVQGKLEDLQNNASATMEEISAIRTLPEERMDLGWTRSFSWNEMIPVYAFRRIGSQTLEKFFWEAIRGQNIIATDLREADDFAKETRKKYGHGKWDMDKVHEFELKDGRTFRVTLRHMMSIYAYSKRPQALDHMTKGGFFFNDKSTFRKKGGVLNLIKSNEVGYSVDIDVLNAIKEGMTSEQRRYVDEMQTYLTKMGNKGNEVSRVLWGIDIFKEQVYFPLKSVKDFIFQANQTAQESSLKNDGMTKETKPGASNPIVLESFDDVWANHVNRMSQYHGLVIPIENLNKIHNYGTWANTDSMSVSTMLRARFGEAVNDYLNNFIKDLNGASSTSGASNPFFSFVGKFKKTAVAASSSVVVQQPTAVMRAMAVMDGKYFVGMPKVKRLFTKWNELQKYAPIAIIKEIGGFDAGAGRQATEWLNSDTRRGIEKIGGKIDDITMMGAAVGDQIGWCTIWEAVKREIKATTNLKEGSEEFLQKAGERFTEVIVLTQVYDSTLSRSGFMRSKHDSVKMLTSFMGEPTVSINMMFDATVQAKRKTITKRKAARIIGATYASILAASIAASLIYALRDDDEDESYLEKFAEAFGGKLLGDINPLNMLPGFRDIISIFDGWDVERTDMAVFKDIKDAFDGLFSENKNPWRKVEDFAGAVASAFGVPLKNLLRTGREIYNGIKATFDDIAPKEIGKAFARGITGEKKEKGNALYNAIVSGDKARLEILRKGYKDDKAYETAVRKALRENDPRIKEAAEARNSGNIAEYSRIVKEIKAEGFFSQDTIVASVNAEINAINKGEPTSTETSTTENKESSIYKMEDYYDSIIGGDQASAYVVKEDLINIDVANGKDRDEAEKDFNSKFASYIREQYEDGNVSEYEAKNLLTQYGEQSSEEATSKVQYWAFKEDYPDYDDLSEEAVAKYYSDVEPYGISIGVYYDYSKQKAKCKGVDSNGDGKTDSGSKKKEILNVINSLPLTYAQKDVLYYLNGWSAKTINEAPWH